MRQDYGARVGSGYPIVRDQTKAILKKTTWAASFRRVGWDFRAALWAKPEYASHYWGAACVLPCLLRKILPEVTPGPQQLNGAIHLRYRWALQPYARSLPAIGFDNVDEIGKRLA